MYELKASFAGLLLIFIILAPSLAYPDSTTCLPTGNNTCRIDYDCCTSYCDIKRDDQYGICKGRLIKLMSEENPFYPTIDHPDLDNCLPLGNNSCEADYECCSNNCVIEHDDLYGICKAAGVKPISEENQFISEECKPLGNDKCEDNLDCCSDNCVLESGAKFGVCKSPITKPRSNTDSVYVNTSPLIDVGCKPLGYNMCEHDYQCCSSYCNIDERKEIGVCETRMSFKSHGVTVNIPANPDSTDDIHDICKHLGNNLCESDHECCSHYCHKSTTDDFFGICEIPNSSRYKNGEDGIYEKGFCTYYKGVNMTLNGEQYDEDEMTASHWTLPFNTYVRVQDVMGRHVAVRINDRRPSKGSINTLQMSVRAAFMLGVRNKKPISCSLTILTDENCTPDFEDTCVLNHECCSRNCHRTSGMEMGKCVSRSDV